MIGLGILKDEVGNMKRNSFGFLAAVPFVVMLVGGFGSAEAQRIEVMGPPAPAATPSPSPTPGIKKLENHEEITGQGSSLPPGAPCGFYWKVRTDTTNNTTTWKYGGQTSDSLYTAKCMQGANCSGCEAPKVCIEEKTTIIPGIFSQYSCTCKEQAGSSAVSQTSAEKAPQADAAAALADAVLSHELGLQSALDRDDNFMIAEERAALGKLVELMEGSANVSSAQLK